MDTLQNCHIWQVTASVYQSLLELIRGGIKTLRWKTKQKRRKKVSAMETYFHYYVLLKAMLFRGQDFSLFILFRSNEN